MSETINYNAQSYKRSIDYNSNFILIGNNIDGNVNLDSITFRDFEDLKLRLPQIFDNLEYFGEWDLKLYQVSNSCQIIKKYGYYKIPNSGKLIFEYNYMDYHIKSILFKDQKMEIIGSHMKVIENWNAKSDEDFLNYEIDIEVKTINFLKSSVFVVS
jgi:hypothetical protein